LPPETTATTTFPAHVEVAQRVDRERPRGLEHHALDVQHLHDRRADAVLRRDHHLLDPVPGERRVVQLADPRHRRAVDEVVDLRQRHRPARRQRAGKRRRARGLDEAHGDPRRARGEDRHHPGRQPAAADRQHDQVGHDALGQLVEDLGGAGCLALDHVGVVEGRQEDGAGLGAMGLRRGERVVEIVADHADLDAARRRTAGSCRSSAAASSPA
jgi:hypothetical protein